MRARLFARFGPEDGLEVEFGAEATIGRGEGNTVLLRSLEVSQRHARIAFDADSAAYWVEDLDSLNGTRLDGEPLSGRQRLGGLHVLSFGAAAELFFLELDREPGEAKAPQAAAPPTMVRKTRVDAEPPALPSGLREVAEGSRTQVDAEVPMLPTGLRTPPADELADASPRAATPFDEAPAVLPTSLAGGEAAAAEAPPGFVLEILGDSPGRFALRQGENLVGRSRRAGVSLRHRELSRHHATLRVAAGRVWVRDEGSRNRTFVAGEPISEEVELEPGSELRFGRLEARLTLAPTGGEEEPG